MSNLIEHNAYRIFGLDSNSNQKDILKRYKEIINRLKIDDYPEYDSDINLPTKLRTEDSVNDALKRLQNTKNGIKEFFFWFQVSDNVDEKAYSHLKNKDYEKAITIWKNASETKNSTSLFYKKNIALIYCLILLKEQNQTYLKESIAIWHEIVNSDKFWNTFAKSYSVNNEQTASPEIIAEFRKNVVKNISDIYTDLYHQYKNAKYIKDFQEIFGSHGDKTEKSLLKPVYEEIHNSIDELNKIKFTENEDIEYEAQDKCENCGNEDAEKYWDYEDGSVLCGVCEKKVGKSWQKKVNELEDTEKEYQKKIRKVNYLISDIDTHFSKLKKMGLFDDSQSKIVRDHAAEALRIKSVELHNIDEFEESSRILKLAIPLCGTDSFKNKVQEDLKTVHTNFENKKKQEEYDEIIGPIVNNWKNGNTDEAFAELEEQLSNKNIDKELKTVLKDMKKQFEERLAEHGKPITEAPGLSTINGIGTTIYGDTQWFVFIFIPIFPLARYSLRHNEDGTYSFFGKLELHNWQKYYIFGMIALIIGFIIWINMSP